jgi:hypothetical protein
MERRLAAILVAGMAGYSRLMEQDEEGVLEEGRLMAKLIPRASFIELPGNNHALLALAGTPAFDQFLEEATTFVAAHAC